MGSEWAICTLKAAGVSLIDCVHKTPPAAEEGYPYVAIPQMKEGRIDFSAGPRLISEMDLSEWTKKADPRKDDIVLSRRCNPGETAYVTGEVSFALGQNLVLLRSDARKIFPPFLRWLVRGPQWWNQVAKYLNVGAVFDSLRCADIPNFELSIPPLNEQRSISQILGVLDDKIELNRQMNTTLEAMAQALFKSWFVDFDPVIDNALAAGNPIPDELADRAERRAKAAQQQSPEHPHTLPAAIRQQFPDRFVFTEDMGWVPEGWQVLPTEQAASKIGMGPFGSNIKVSTFVKSGVPIISGQHLKGTLLKDADFNYITDDHARKLKNSLVTSGDVIFTHAGSIGQVALIPEGSFFQNYVISQRQFYLRPDTAKTPSSYLLYYFRSHQGQHLLLANASQVGVPSIARPSSHLKSIPLLLPCIKILEEFDKQCARIFNSQRHNAHQIEILETLRNTLLPKLLCGQLRIAEAEQLLAEAL